ncbi:MULTISPECIES: hypothetical protein [unclassified Methylobacterium]|uniref:hypothetical protein n=1 Tax=unclassified Methylobacterium TaxID=2615210 RepID=UPI0003A9BE03|nr:MULTISPECIES: hypothetical protein [Methylobacterium]WFT81307.1 hypothetical protein QA634_05280 [Methylobacterium nodulans]
MAVLEELPFGVDVSESEDYLVIEKSGIEHDNHNYIVSGKVKKKNRSVLVTTHVASFEEALVLAKHLADRLEASLIYIRDDAQPSL